MARANGRYRVQSSSAAVFAFGFERGSRLRRIVVHPDPAGAGVVLAITAIGGVVQTVPIPATIDRLELFPDGNQTIRALSWTGIRYIVAETVS